MSNEIALALQPLTSRIRTDITATKNKEGVSIWTDQSLTHNRLVAHIENKKARGVCPIREGQTTTAVALLDLDSHKGETSWQDMLKVAREVADHAADFYGLRAVPFSSSGGRGIHLYFIFDQQQDAYSVRETLKTCLGDLGYKNGTAGVAEKQIEIFPKQDCVPQGGFGNQFILPLFNKSMPLDLSRGELPKDAVLKSDWWRMSRAVDPVTKPERTPKQMPTGDLAKWVPYVMAIDPDCSYEEWLRVGMALHFESDADASALSLWDEWSAMGTKYPGFEKLESRWIGFGGKDSEVTGGSIEAIARVHGYIGDFIDLYEDNAAVGIPTTPSNVIDIGTRKSVGGPLPTFKRNADGEIEATINNIKMALSRPDFCGVEVRHDTFTDEIIFRNDGGDKWFPLTDNDTAQVRLNLERRGFRPIGKEQMRDMIALDADDNQFDSAIDWLNGIDAWDGVPRIDTFMRTYFQTDDTPYTRSLGAYIWTALAGRVLSPGIKVDIVPILVGAQGLRKSTAVAAMSPNPDWFCEISFHEKEDVLARLMRGKAVAEIAELNGLRTKEIEAIKAFLARQREHWVPKFKEFSTTYPRRLLFIGTTNKDQFLMDETGHRRMAPQKVGMAQIDALRADRAQLWAEGRARYLAGGIEWQAVEELAKAEHEQYVIVDGWQDQIESWLSVPDMGGALPMGKGYVLSAEIYSGALSMAATDAKPQDDWRLSKILRVLNFEQKRVRIDKHLMRVWVKTAGCDSIVTASKRDAVTCDDLV